jgi:heptosyltransferase III
VEEFVALAARLARELRVQPLFSLGEADDGVASYLSAERVPFPVLRDLRLPELAVVLSVSCGYVGNDAGITHLAAAVGAPVVALFGPSDPALWAPRGPHVHIVRAPHPSTAGLAELSVNDVFAACTAAFAR